MIIILIIAAIVSAIISKAQNTGDYVDSIIIILIVILNALMGLIQEEKAEKAMESLKKMSAPTAKVRRNNKIITIDAVDVVPGDVVILEAGNYVPADCRLIKAFNLKIEESSLTGETVPILKDADVILKKSISLGDMVNMCFATTVIVNGHGEAIVTETGMNTSVGKIAKMIISDKTPETPIQKKLGEVGKILGLGCLFICLLIFIIGLIKKIEPVEMFMTSVGLAVAAIPEGLPAIVTIMLSIGVTKMAKKNAIIRKLPAVETLGSSSVICSDKTGTLTKNKMKVVEIYDINKSNSNSEYIIELATMCTDSEIVSNNEGIMEADGEPTENAIVNEGLKFGKNKNELYTKMQRIGEIPFDSNRKMMTTIHRVGNKYRIITKGAPDVLIRKCNKYYDKGMEKHLNENNIKKLELINNEMGNNALRVIGVAYKDIDFLPSNFESDYIENSLTFVGLIGMIDPPREGVREAVETCKKAGIKTVMITGDHIVTAKAIASRLGILNNGDLSITGDELDRINQKQLEKDIMKYSVFARVSPEHKVKIVKAFRKTGAVVAMTGDGVNDAPALRNADIGIAMGKNGTDVAKNASDMILTDDNFITIVEAVKEGRNIFVNIVKAIHFLLSTNIGEIVAIFIGLILGFDSPLLAIQLLWVNLVTDSFSAIALGLEPPDRDIMDKKPRNTRKGIFADGLWNKIFAQGTMIGMLTLMAFSIGNRFYGINIGRTMAFLSLGLLELVHSFNIKSEESIFKVGITDNKYLLGAFALGTLLQTMVVIIPQIASVFELTPLNLSQWIYTIIISLMPIPIIEIQKWVNGLKFKPKPQNAYKKA